MKQSFQSSTKAVPDENVSTGHTPNAGLDHDKLGATGQHSASCHHPNTGLEFQNLDNGKTTMPEPGATFEDKLKTTNK